MSVESSESWTEPIKAPGWVRELDMALAVYPQILLTGNVRDQYFLHHERNLGLTAPGPQSRPGPFRLIEVIESLCEARGYGFVARQSIADDLVSFSSIGPHRREAPEFLRRAAEPTPVGEPVGQADAGALDIDYDRLTARTRQLFTEVARHKGSAIAMVVPYAGRFGSSRAPAADLLGLVLGTVEELGHEALRTGVDSDGHPLFNTIFWVIEKQEDLPLEFPLGSRALRVITVPDPPHDQRLGISHHVVERAVAQSASGMALSDQEQRDAADRLARASHGLGVREILAIGDMARDQGLPPERISDAARLYRVGVLDNPWATPAVRNRIRNGVDYLNGRVVGQEHAVRRTIEILRRSATNLTGAQAGSSPNRPRGTLFLSGPTGVGKTELAKGIATMIHGDDARPIRFDMSEFAEEHARDRLIGAPPGYVGHGSGGELTNAVRAHPMSVLLFDEIEKAHPRIFDLFLQILEDGRLTDGQGATVHFTECILIFTSNLGVAADVVRTRGYEQRRAEDQAKGEPDDRPDADSVPSTRGPLSRTDRPEHVRQTLRQAFDKFFNEHIGRPELRNRFGDAFVPMDFIKKEFVPKILDRSLDSVVERIRETYGAELIISDECWEILRIEAVARLDHGGRGVVTAVESALVNPLSWSLFDDPPKRGEHIEVLGISGSDEVFVVELKRRT